ncbi:hypothetical protein HDV05_007630 [Chytridiales sp. JEL 0842]|nr:hypothetical protein HDV05_007630 [Chytridiales sp. JEL 0842]
MARLAGKVVLITGASSGIGHACAKEFAKNNSHVILAARRLDRLTDLKKEIETTYPNVSVHALELDVRDRKKVFASIESLPEKFKDIYVLVNNAGLVKGMDHIDAASEDTYDVIFDTNVKGLLNVTQAVLVGMKKRESGVVVNVGSISGTEVYPGGGLYCASKHAVDALTRTLRMELLGTGIRVASVDPGMVETEFTLVRFHGDENKAKSYYDGFQPLSGQDVAEAVVFSSSRPPHVNIGKMVVLPAAQAAVHMTVKKGV